MNDRESGKSEWLTVRLLAEAHASAMLGAHWPMLRRALPVAHGGESGSRVRLRRFPAARRCWAPWKAGCAAGTGSCWAPPRPDPIHHPGRPSCNGAGHGGGSRRVSVTHPACRSIPIALHWPALLPKRERLRQAAPAIEKKHGALAPSYNRWPRSDSARYHQVSQRIAFGRDRFPSPCAA